MRIRIIRSIVGDSIDYRPGQVVDVGSTAAASLIAAGHAIAEGPAPADAIAELYEDAGFIELTPDPSGYVGPSGYIADAPSGGGYIVGDDDYTFTVVYPGKVETTFDLMRLRPRLS